MCGSQHGNEPQHIVDLVVGKGSVGITFSSASEELHMEAHVQSVIVLDSLIGQLFSLTALFKYDVTKALSFQYEGQSLRDGND